MIDGAETRRYRATIAYDGTGYHGFQRQLNASPTVQGTLEEAVKAISGQAVGVIGAGRTDAGVHANGQVIAFDLNWRHAPDDLKNALNATLPVDLVVRHLEATRPDFHPRFDAVSRTYSYRIWQAPVQDPLNRHRQWHVREALAVEAITQAVEGLPGEHDFGAFGTPPQGEVTRRTVHRATWQVGPADQADARVHEFVIEANAFLYRMVRRLVGTLWAVGTGRITPQAFEALMAAADRSHAGPTAPPEGLTLTAVKYRQGD